MTDIQTISFERLLDKNKHKIYRICCIYATAPISPEDLFQEVLYAIWKSLNSFKGQSHIDTWVYRITLNICMRSKQHLEKRQLQTLTLDTIEVIPAKQAANSIEAKKHEALMACIQTLDALNKSIVILFLDGLKYKAIADITGLTENHIAVKMKRIKQQLKTCINSKL